MKTKFLSLFLATVLAFPQASFAAAVSDDTLTLGKPGSSANKTIKFGSGSGNKPQIRYNATGAALEYSSDGVDFQEIGSGGGGAGGINLITNPDFEKTPVDSGWTASAGTVMGVTVGANFSGLGKKSISWTPAGSSNTLVSTAATIPNGLFGAKGSLSIFYKTTSSAYKLQLWNGTTVLKETTIAASSTFKQIELPQGFIFPSSGTVALRILSGDTTPIYLDKAYGGSFNSYTASGAATANFLANGDIENGAVSEWKCFSSGSATARPVDGMSFGGTPTVTMAASDTTPLYGTYSAIFTKTAANSQGQGCYQDYKIEDGDLNKILNLSFEYKVNGGTFIAGVNPPATPVDSDVIVYAYDVDAGKVIEPTSIKLLSSSTSFGDMFVGSIVPQNNTSKNYRIFFYIPNTTSATGFSLKIDSFKLTRTQNTVGTPITDWRDYTPTWGSSGSTPAIGNGQIKGKWRRVGDSVEGSAYVIAGSSTTKGSGSYWLSIPPGLSADASKLNDTGIRQVVGSGIYLSATNTTSAQVLATAMNGVNSVQGVSDQNATSNTFASTQSNVFNATNDAWTLNYLIPIQGWSSQTVMSSDAGDSRPVGLTVKGYSDFVLTPAQSGTNASITNYTNVVEDTHGGYSNGRYTIPSSGRYRLYAMQFYNIAAAGAWQVGLYLNGSETLQVGNIVPYQANNYSHVTYSRYFKAGDIIDVRPTNNTGSSNVTVNSGGGNVFVVEKIGGGNGTIAASDPIYARYVASTGQGVDTGVSTRINYATKDFDNTSSVATGASWAFVAPASGKYQFNASVQYASAAGGGTVYISAVKNGVTIGQSYTYTAATAAPWYAAISDITHLNAGDTLYFTTLQNSGSTKALQTDNTFNRVSIVRIGL